METIALRTFTGVVRSLADVPHEVTKAAGELSGAGSLYRWMRTEHPVWRSSQWGGYWVVSRFDDACDVLRDTESFSSAYSILVPPEQGQPNLVALIGTDPPEHTRVRKLLAHYATPKAVQHFGSVIEQLVVDYIQRVSETGECDLVEDLIAPLHGRILARFVGVPEKDWHLFRQRKERVVDARLASWVDRPTAARGPAVGGCPVVHTTYGSVADDAAVQAIRAYITTLFDARLAAGDSESWDLAALLLRARESGDLTDEDCADIVYTMFIAGNDTVVHGLSRAAYLLYSDPRLRAAVAAAESWSALSPVVDEVLRLQSPVEGLARVATKDTTIGDTPIAAGDRVLILYAAANRDPSRFIDPEELQPDRAPNPHLAYGFGRHRCLGAPLAHLEMQIVIWHMVHSMAAYRVDEDRVTIDPGSSGWGVAKLPVRLLSAAEVPAI